MTNSLLLLLLYNCEWVKFTSHSLILEHHRVVFWVQFCSLLQQNLTVPVRMLLMFRYVHVFTVGVEFFKAIFRLIYTVSTLTVHSWATVICSQKVSLHCWWWSWDIMFNVPRSKQHILFTFKIALFMLFIQNRQTQLFKNIYKNKH